MRDQNLVMSDNQSLAQVVATYVSDKTIDTGPAAGTPNLGGPLTNPYLGRTTPDMHIVVEVTTGFDSAGAATLRIQVCQSDAADGTGNVGVLRETALIDATAAGTKLTAGKILRLGGVPPMSRRYLSLNYVIGTATTTAGKVTAALDQGVPSNGGNFVVGY
jgi:hypothetical protein